MIKIDSSELEKFSVFLSNKAVKSVDDVGKVIRKSTLNIQRGARENLASNGSVKTGHLRRSIAYKLSPTEGIVHTSNVVYAMGLEKGTKAHIIRPKNKKALYWKGAAHPVKGVRHPGSKAKPYLIPAFEKEKSNFIDELGKIMEW